MTEYRLSYGRIDRWIGVNVAFPIVSRLARTLGNFRLARVLLVVGCLLWFADEAFTHDVAQIALGSILNPLFAAWVWFAMIRGYERASESLSSDTLSFDLLRRTIWVANTRIIWLVMMIVLEAVSQETDPCYSVGWISVVLALYATTCIVPRKPSKIVAKAKALMERAPALTPAPIPTAA